MTTRENLIPDGLPYGERQGQREAMGMAGVPTEVTGPPPGVAAALAAPGGAPAPAPEEGDMLLGTEPSMPLLSMPGGPGSDPLARFRELRDTSPNPFIRRVLAAFLED